MRRIVGIALLVALSLHVTPVLIGTEPRARATTARVRIVDDAFRPRVLTISRGTRVRWVNVGSSVHTTTSTRGLWDSGLLEPGESYSRVFRRSGTFRYVCTVHTSMTGKVIVT
jgi:plastocyanin